MKEQSQEKPHLSYSQVNTYLACPLRYRFHYIDQMLSPFNVTTFDELSREDASHLITDLQTHKAA